MASLRGTTRAQYQSTQIVTDDDNKHFSEREEPCLGLRLVFPPGTSPEGVSAADSSRLAADCGALTVPLAAGASSWQVIVFQNSKSVGRLVKPRVAWSDESAFPLDHLTLVFDAWQGVIAAERKLSPGFQSVRIPVDAAFQSSNFRLQIIGGSTGSSAFALPSDFSFSGSEASAALGQHLQQIDYIKQQRSKFVEAAASSASPAASSGHPLLWSQQQYIFERGDLYKQYQLMFDIREATPCLQQVSLRLAVLRPGSDLVADQQLSSSVEDPHALGSSSKRMPPSVKDPHPLVSPSRGASTSLSSSTGELHRNSGNSAPGRGDAPSSNCTSGGGGDPGGSDSSGDDNGSDNEGGGGGRRGGGGGGGGGGNDGGPWGSAERGHYLSAEGRKKKKNKKKKGGKEAWMGDSDDSASESEAPTQSSAAHPPAISVSHPLPVVDGEYSTSSLLSPDAGVKADQDKALATAAAAAATAAVAAATAATAAIAMTDVDIEGEAPTTPARPNGKYLHPHASKMTPKWHQNASDVAAAADAAIPHHSQNHHINVQNHLHWSHQSPHHSQDHHARQNGKPSPGNQVQQNGKLNAHHGAGGRAGDRQIPAMSDTSYDRSNGYSPSSSHHSHQKQHQHHERSSLDFGGHANEEVSSASSPHALRHQPHSPTAAQTLGSEDQPRSPTSPQIQRQQQRLPHDSDAPGMDATPSHWLQQHKRHPDPERKHADTLDTPESPVASSQADRSTSWLHDTNSTAAPPEQPLKNRASDATSGPVRSTEPPVSVWLIPGHAKGSAVEDRQERASNGVAPSNDSSRSRPDLGAAPGSGAPSNDNSRPRPDLGAGSGSVDWDSHSKQQQQQQQPQPSPHAHGQPSVQRRGPGSADGGSYSKQQQRQQQQQQPQPSPHPHGQQPVQRPGSGSVDGGSHSKQQQQPQPSPHPHGQQQQQQQQQAQPSPHPHGQQQQQPQPGPPPPVQRPMASGQTSGMGAWGLRSSGSSSNNVSVSGGRGRGGGGMTSSGATGAPGGAWGQANKQLGGRPVGGSLSVPSHNQQHGVRQGDMGPPVRPPSRVPSPAPSKADSVDVLDRQPGQDPSASSDLERFLVQVTPLLSLVDTCGSTKPVEQAFQDLCLDDVWKFYLEPSMYGREVYTLGGSRGPSLCYFVPYLSAIQLFTPTTPRDTVSSEASRQMYVSDTEGWPRHMRLKFEFFEQEMPFNRMPLFEQIENLAAASVASAASSPPAPHCYSHPPPPPPPATSSSPPYSGNSASAAIKVGNTTSDATNAPVKGVGTNRDSATNVDSKAQQTQPLSDSNSNLNSNPDTVASLAKPVAADGVNTASPSAASSPQPCPSPSPCPSEPTLPFLRSARIAELHPASWFAVAWYPVYRIPDAPLCARFLTFHSFAPLVISMQHAAAAMERGQQRPVAIMPLQVVGLQWYNMHGERWMDSLSDNVPSSGSSGASGSHTPTSGMTGGAAGRRGPSPSHFDFAWQAHLSELQATAERLARGFGIRVLGPMGSADVRMRHPDYEFFSTRA